jgi:succinyl-diaminopimelate desuccinylase
LGGAVVDPGNVLVAALRRMSNVVADWHADPPSLPRRLPATLELPDAAIIRAARGRATTGTELHRRITDGAAFSISSVRSTGGRGSVAASSFARVDVRLPPRTVVGTAVALLRRAARLEPQGTRVNCSVVAANPGHLAVPDPAVLSVIDRATRLAFGRPVVVLRSGGSLPAVTVLHRVFGRAPVLLGLGTPAGGAHGPDEFLDIPGWCAAVEMLVRLFADPARLRSPEWAEQHRTDETHRRNKPKGAEIHRSRHCESLNYGATMALANGLGRRAAG